MRYDDDVVARFNNVLMRTSKVDLIADPCPDRERERATRAKPRNHEWCNFKFEMKKERSNPRMMD
jgi:hypothetical protein